MMKVLYSILILLLFSVSSFAQEKGALLQAVQIYTQDELLDLIKENKHLERVKADRCQLNLDIKDRAEKLHIPAYEFLYGDMLAWGVCLDANPELGLYYIKKAAEQGLTAAIEQLGRYYHIGRFVQKDIDKAYVYIQRAAEQGHLNAKFRLIEMQLEGIGSPYDFENSYRWLHHSVIADRERHKQAGELLAKLATKMHPNAVKNAKKDQ